MLMEFLLSSLNIACVIFQLINAEHVGGEIFAFSVISIYVLQQFVFAWHANEIAVESSRLSEAIYTSEWYQCSTKIQKIMKLVVLRSQKPLFLTIGNFRPLTTQTVISTFSTYVLNKFRNFFNVHTYLRIS
ncbi:hypothetical protein ABEB36_001580 [Hypothenemus hampei]|uniref:Uncharacterized protein n=1 Tax=Hypothenemus hampei TaxID=57062 RepID=A0ABD1FF15_HYPHA